jgi:hypothetical protein
MKEVLALILGPHETPVTLGLRRHDTFVRSLNRKPLNPEACVATTRSWGVGVSGRARGRGEGEKE